MEEMDKKIMDVARSAVKEYLERLMTTERDVFLDEHGGLRNGHYERTMKTKFVETLLKRRKEWLFRFVVDQEVEPTNNRAERALRPVVIYGKTSGGSRSDRGANTYARSYSIFYTTKIRKKSFTMEVPGMTGRRESHPG